MRRILRRLLLALGGLLAVLCALVLWLDRPRAPQAGSDAPATSPDAVARGAYLARAGNCAACHTARGGAPFAGGVPIDTPFGVVYGSNLTPDPETGLGRWSAADFRRAMHDGRSRDGRRLYPAFPYPNFTRIPPADADALFAYLRSLAPVRQPNRAHAVRFPYDTQPALAVWRALFFRPGFEPPDPARAPEWNRGRDLVHGLGHCDACHAPRNVLGATSRALELGGGLIPMQKWYAPSLAASHEAGVAGWPVDEVVALLKTGVAPRGSVQGPMAEVVFRSLQHLSDGDLRAMASYLQSLSSAPPEPHDPIVRERSQMARGAELYETHCAGCHGKQGEGAPGAYPALAGNRGVTLGTPTNLVRVLVHGGYLPATAGNPRPFGMPPFGHVLDDADMAALLTYLRGAWGNDAQPVWPVDVLRWR